jgi:hypothetical protein
MKFKGVIKDQAFWRLFVINLAIIVYYLYHGTGFKTLVWIYWCQSVLIGFFTFLQLITIKVLDGDDKDISQVKAYGGRGCMGSFFAFHFGFFHLGYLIFLFTITDIHERIDWQLFEFSVGAFALDQLWSFIKLKQWGQTHQLNGGLIFFLPYARIVPMHLTILLPKFIGVPQMGLFLVLKMFADLLMYVISTAAYGKEEWEDPTLVNTIK